MTRTRPFADLLAKIEADPVRRARVGERKRAIEDALVLADLRSQAGVTQREMAQALNVSQSRVSKIEHAEDLYLSTLRNYVEALGSHLEINTVFGDQTVELVESEK